MKTPKASTFIKNTCCGHSLDIPKRELVAMVEHIEADNERMSTEIKRLENDKKSSFVMFASLSVAFVVWALIIVCFK